MGHDVTVKPDYARLAAAIVAARKARGWLQNEFIQTSGLGKSTVQRLERGESGSPYPTRTTITILERVLGWSPGSVEIVLEGGDPTRLPGHASPGMEPPATPDGAGQPQISALPLAARNVLEQGELLDTEVIDLSRPGTDFHILVVAKVGITDDEEKRERMRQAIEQWLMLRKGIRDMADYRPGPDPEPEAPPSDRPSD
jgi:transcriptional regulator with XRE-family HTH domain